jgi:two-component sensor histidine kinase/CHASE3 domain sensor protein
MTTPVRITRYATSLLAIGFIALLVIVAMTFWLGDRSRSSFNNVTRLLDTSNAAVELRYALQAAESSQRGYLATANQIYLAPYSTARTLAYAEAAKLEAFLADRIEERPVLRRLREVMDNKFAEMSRTIDLKRNREDAEALAILKTNRGKALMDEANVFLSSIVRRADEKLTAAVGEQREDAFLLRIINIVGGALIVVVVAIVIAIIIGYTRDLERARDSVRELNAGLEKRVDERTSELARSRDRAEMLLAEVNHRVANSLALVGSMVSLQAKSATSDEAREVLAETQARITAVGLAHRRLHTSGEIRVVALNEYLPALVEQLSTSLQGAGHNAHVSVSIAPVAVPTDKSVSLGVILTEWITNAFKYAYPGAGGKIEVTLGPGADGTIELAVRDFGVGRREAEKPKGTGLGTKLVQAMASSIGARVEYLDGHPGTIARLLFAPG